MPFSKLSPIGLNVNETISLQSRLYQDNLEQLISCCLVVKSEELNQSYENLRNLSPQNVKQVISHPLLNVAIYNLIRGIRESSEYFILNGGAQLKWLIESLQKDFWIPFELNRSIYLPHDGIILQSTKSLEGLYIHRESAYLSIPIDGAVLKLKFNKQSNFLTFNLKGQHWLTAWRFNEDVFCVDSISKIYTAIIPGGYEPEKTSPRELKKWSDSISNAVQLLELCGLNDILGELKSLVRVIVPLKSKKDSHLSSSSPDFPGVICMSWTDDILQILEAVIHEAGHHKLCVIERDSPITNSSEETFRSPWRDDLRPAHGLIHGAYVFLGAAVLWDSLLKSESLPKNYITSINNRKKVALAQIGDALSELTRVDCLTEVGFGVANSIKQIHNSLMTGCDFDLLHVETQTRISSIDRNRSELSLLDDFAKDFNWILPLYTSTEELLEKKFEKVGFSKNAASIAKRRLPKYYLWFALPLVDAFNLSEKLDEAKFWASIHICFGLVWRFIDEVEDEHSSDVKEQQLFYDTALGLLIENVELLSTRKIRFSSKLRKLLFQFYAYRAVETNGTIKVKDIWRRASAFLVVPAIWRDAQRTQYRAYREYCILLGLLDDLEDGWEDLRTGRRTWVTQLLATKSPTECRLEFQSMCDYYQQRLLKIVPKDRILWRKLLDQSFEHCQNVISKII